MTAKTTEGDLAARYWLTTAGWVALAIATQDDELGNADV